jgi:serine/threonine protein kinase/tetratricopeptide (TPR) repeat protein
MAQGDERDLILGLLVQRLGLASPEDAFRAIEAERKRTDIIAPLLEVFVVQGLITPTSRSLLESVADELIRCHGGDAEAALKAMVGGAVPSDDDQTKTLPGPVGPGTRYEILAELTRGGMGQILRANDALLGREVLVKQVLADAAREPFGPGNDPAREALFARERRTAAGLEHPNIAPVYDAGSHGDGRPFYVMRYIRGDTLKQVIARHHPAPAGQTAAERSLQLRDLLGRFVAVCEAVAYAHARGVLHRDIKPANILLGDFGETQLIDWGLAKVGSDEIAQASGGGCGSVSGSLPPLKIEASDSDPTAQGQVKGTPAFMAPEQAEGALARIGPPTDVYGLGATLYQILTGRSAFQGAPTEFLPDVIRGIFPRPRQVNPGVAPALEAICLKAMAREPADRYPSAKALAGDIDRWLADEPVGVYRDPWTKRAVRFAKRHRTAMTAVGAVAATAVMWIAAGYVIVSGQLAETERARMLAARSRDELAMNVQETMEVIDTFLIRMAADDWARFPGSEVARREMAEKAIRKLQDIQAHSSHDNGLRYGIARAERTAGLLALVTADHEAAGKYFDLAHMLLSQMIKSRSDDDYRAHDTFANLLLDQSDLAMQTEGPRKAVEYLEAARNVSGMIPPERSARLLGRVAAAWGNHLLAVERWDEAVEEFQAATRLFDEKPPQGNRSLEIVHARAWHGRGLAERLSGRGDGSVAWQRTRELIEASRARWPDDPNVLATAAKFTVIETECDDTGRTDERMRKALDEVVDEIERLVAAFPQTAGYRLLAVRARVVRAEKAVAAGQHAAGRADADRAIELAKTDAKGTGATDWRDLEILARAYAARGRASPPPDAVHDLREACRLWQIVLARNPAQRSNEQALEAARRDLAKVQPTMP